MTPDQRAAALRLAAVPICDRSIGWQSDTTILLRELAAEPVQEPVAWMDKYQLGGVRLTEAAYGLPHGAPLYAAAPQSQPLTRERCADALRCALEALDYCIEDSAELLNERTAQWGQYRKDRQAAMAETLERHRAAAERLRAMLMA